jgi:hypothetical protein
MSPEQGGKTDSQKYSPVPVDGEPRNPRINLSVEVTATRRRRAIGIACGLNFRLNQLFDNSVVNLKKPAHRCLFEMALR